MWNRDNRCIKVWWSFSLHAFELDYARSRVITSWFIHRFYTPCTVCWRCWPITHVALMLDYFKSRAFSTFSCAPISQIHLCHLKDDSEKKYRIVEIIGRKRKFRGIFRETTIIWDTKTHLDNEDANYRLLLYTYLIACVKCVQLHKVVRQQECLNRRLVSIRNTRTLQNILIRTRVSM